jgi:plastocyanin
MTRGRLAARLGGIVIGTSVLVACGGSPSAPSGSSGSSGGSSGPTVTITSAGVSPKELTVSPGTRVLFVNNDSRLHDMSSDPHPAHDDCVEINQVGLLQPGQRRETGNLNTVRTCGYHDHDLPQNEALKGRIVIR